MHWYVCLSVYVCTRVRTWYFIMNLAAWQCSVEFASRAGECLIFLLNTFVSCRKILRYYYLLQCL